MTKSNLVSYTKLSPNHSGKRTQKVSKITIHHMAGNLSVEQCGAIFANSSRQASSNYGIGSDGRIALYVDEDNRAWTSGNDWNDQRAITIEVANDNLTTWSISKKAWNSLMALCADICDRYNIVPSYDGTKNASFTEHRMFQSTACPGSFIHKYLADGTIIKEVQSKLKNKAKTGWQKNSKGWWYVNNDGTYPTDKWQKINGKWYFFNAKGYMVTGWIEWKSGFYYCESSGAMVTGTKSGLTCRFNSSGKMIV